MKHLLRSKKGVGTALGAVFFITLAIMSITTMWAISAYEARYQRVREEMTEWDIQRISENLNVKAVENSTNPDYTFNLLVDNVGGVTVNIARIYVYDQNKSSLKVYDPQSGSGHGFVNGTINTGEANHKICVKGEALDDQHEYRIILTTDRGRQFSITKVPVSEEEGAGVGGGYPIVIAVEVDNFQYQDKVHSYHVWSSAWIKPKSSKSQHPLYRILLNNTTSKDIDLKIDSYMLPGSGKGSQNVRYIVSSSTDVDDPHPTQFTSQTIPAHSTAYVYFAASDTSSDPDWVEDKSPGFWQVSFLIVFNYHGEADTLTITLPAQAQRIT